MEVLSNYGAWSLVPALIAVILAFVTREAVFSLLIACIVGLFILGDGLMGLSPLFQKALGNGDFIWVLTIEVFIGILIAFFQVSGSTMKFSNMMENKITSRVKVQLFGWVLGMFVFFSDYFSPLFVGPVMQKLTDKAKISREKLAYICDSTSAPMCVLIPFSAWGVYIAGLMVGMGPIVDTEQAIVVYSKSIPFNFYGILAILMVGAIAAKIIPEFGPMKKAEKRAMEEGKVLADNASPMMGSELSEMKVSSKIVKPTLILNFFIPVLIILVVAVGSYFVFNTTKTLEAFMFSTLYLGLILKVQKVPLKEIFTSAVQGIKGVVPAIIILALAYCINTISRDLGTANYVIELSEGWLKPALLPFVAFSLAAFISFSTGTSWGTYAIIIPIAIPMAFAISGNQLDTIVYATIGAVAGGGVFGDHCSPLSDTTILSSLGAGSDHIDHVKTQLPYASAAALVGVIIYLGLGLLV